MIEYQTVTDFLSQFGTLFIKGNNVNMRCMLCGDSKKSKLKKRFNVTYDNGSAFYHCFNCGKTGTFAELVAELKGISLGEAIRSIETIEFCDIEKRLQKECIEVNDIEEVTTIEDLNYILDDCISVDSEVSSYVDKQYKKHLISFIENRKIPKEYNVFVATKGEYKNRYIIPIYHWGDIVYFQGRAMRDDMLPRFKNPEVEKSGIIMNIEHFNKDKFIIVTEGIIDAMALSNHQGTCVLGGSVSDDFLSVLYKSTNKGVIIAVDNDERGQKERDKLIRDSKYGKLLRYYVTPSNVKDLNEHKIKNNIDNMYDEVVSKSVDYWTLSMNNYNHMSLKYSD